MLSTPTAMFDVYGSAESPTGHLISTALASRWTLSLKMRVMVPLAATLTAALAGVVSETLGATSVIVAVGVGVNVGVAVVVGVNVGVTVVVGVRVGVCVAVAVTVSVDVEVPVGVAVAVPVALG